MAGSFTCSGSCVKSMRFTPLKLIQLKYFLCTCVLSFSNREHSLPNRLISYLSAEIVKLDSPGTFIGIVKFCIHVHKPS